MNTTPGQINEPAELHGNAETSIEHKEYETKLDLLYDVAQQASSALEVSDLLKEIPFIIQKILSASASLLFLVDEEKWQFRMRVLGDKKQKSLEEITQSLDYGIAGWVARNNKPLLIDDVSHDERYQENIDAINGLATKSIIATPLGRGSKVIGVLELINKADQSNFQKEDLGLLTEFSNTEALILLLSMATTLMNNFKFCQSLQNQYKDTVETLVTFADAKDPYSYGHSRRVKEYSLIMANSLHLPPEELKLIEFGALLHDIGKLGIDDRILRKPESLTSEEWYIIRKHTIKGANIVRLIPSLQNTADLILYHHERHDGKGYPEGLKGDQIPIGSQIIAVADAFETMTTDRAYRAAMSIDQAITELKNNSGTQFSPRVVEVFISVLHKQTELLENLERQQKPMEVLKQDAALEETYQNNSKTPEQQPVPENTLMPKINVIKDTAENQENKPASGKVIESSAEKTVAQPVPEKVQKQETPVPKATHEDKGDKPIAGEILKILTDNTGTPPVTEKSQKQETREPKNVSGNVEKQPVADETKKSLPEKAETEPVIIDVSKQKKKEKTESSELLKNKENQLEAAEMLKKLLGDVRTRKDLQDKKTGQPFAEVSMPPKPQEVPASIKPQELPAKSLEESAPSKPREVPKPEIASEIKETQSPVQDSLDQDAEDAGKQKPNRKQAEKEAKLAAKKAEQEAKKEKQEAKKTKKTRSVTKAIDISSELFEGDVKLEITPFIDFKQTDQIKKYLMGIDNVKVISQGWSEEEGYIFFLSITEPTVLGPIFQRIPGVQKVYGDGKRIVAEGKSDETDTPEEPDDE